VNADLPFKDNEIASRCTMSPLLLDVRGRIDSFECVEALSARSFDDINIQLKT